MASKTYQIGRSAITGHFKPVAKAQQEKNTSTVETFKKTTPTKPSSSKK